MPGNTTHNHRAVRENTSLPLPPPTPPCLLYGHDAGAVVEVLLVVAAHGQEVPVVQPVWPAVGMQKEDTGNLNSDLYI